MNMKDTAMTILLSALTTDPATFGLAGLAGQIAWPLFRTRFAILTIQIGTACSFAAHYALLGQSTGMAVCLIGAAQSLTALAAGNRQWLPAAFLPVVWLVGLATWSGPATALAVTACTLIMLGRMQRCTLRMRAVMLAAAPFGITHDITVGAVPALIGALLSAALSVRALRRELIARGNLPQTRTA